MRPVCPVERTYLLIVIAILAVSCKNYQDFEPIEGVDYSGELAFPLVNGSTNLQEIIDQTDSDISELTVHPDGTLELVYEGNAISENIANQYNLLSTFPLAIVDNNTEVTVPFAEGLEVSQMRLKSGVLSFDLQSNHTEDIEVLITLPNLTKDGQAFNVTKTIPYTGASPATASIPPIDMLGYSLSLNAGKMQLHYQAKKANGEYVLIDPIMGMAENWTYSYVEGNWATDSFNLTNDTLHIELYDEWVGGDVNFADPRLTLTIDNSFGIPTRALIDEIEVLTTDGESILLESDQLDSGIDLLYPALTETGQSKQTVLEFNNTNSNIAEIVNAKPQRVTYKLTAVVNPDQSGGANGFMTDQSSIDLSLKASLPVYGTASGFEIEEPLETDLGDLDNVESATIKLIVDNGLPVELGLQVYFLDETGQKVDSLFADTEYLVKSAAINTQGMVTDPIQSVSFIPFSAHRLSLLQQSNRMLVNATISTADEGNTPVRILSTHTLGVKAGMRVVLED